MSPRPHLAKKARLRFDPRARRQMLLAPERGLLLDDVAAAVLALCDGERTLADIARELQSSFGDASESTIATDIRRFLDDLSRRGLVVWRET